MSWRRKVKSLPKPNRLFSQTRIGTQTSGERMGNYSSYGVSGANLKGGLRTMARQWPQDNVINVDGASQIYLIDTKTIDVIPKEHDLIHVGCILCRIIDMVAVPKGAIYDMVDEVDIFGFRLKGKVCYNCHQPLYLLDDSSIGMGNLIFGAKVKSIAYSGKGNLRYSPYPVRYEWTSAN